MCVVLGSPFVNLTEQVQVVVSAVCVIQFPMPIITQTVSVPWVELINNGEKTVQYRPSDVQVSELP